MDNDEEVSTLGQRNIKIVTYVSGKKIEGMMYEVLYAPKMTHNLFSVRMAAKKGVNFELKNNGHECIFLRNGKIIAVSDT